MNIDKEIMDEAAKVWTSQDGQISAKESLRIAKKELLSSLFVMKQDADIHALVKKLIEEQGEVRKAYTIADKLNLVEELLDEIQMALTILIKLDIDLPVEIVRHNLKLLKRNWNFEKRVFKLLED